MVEGAVAPYALRASRFVLRHLAGRLERCHARRSNEGSAEGQTGAE